MTAPQNTQLYEPLNIPSKPQTPGAATGRNQKDRRYTDTFFDNHRHPVRFPNGRPWCGPREIAANTELLHEDGFCIPDLMQGEYIEDDAGNVDRAATLRAVWTAPWRPLAKYFRFNYPKKRITFEYAKMRLEEEQGLRQYYRAASKLGIQLNLRVEPGVLPHPQIVNELGEPSRMLTVAEAAMAGDPWLLGFIDEPNPTLADILGIHAIRGIANYASYTPPVPQPQVVEAIIAAPPNADLLEMIAQLSQQVAALSADSAKRKAKGEQLRAGKSGKKNTSNPTPKPAGDAAA